MPDTPERDVVAESRALLLKTAPQGKITNGADAYLFDMQGPRLLVALCDEVERLRTKLADPCLVAGYHVCGGAHNLSDLTKD